MKQKSCNPIILLIEYMRSTLLLPKTFKLNPTCLKVSRVSLQREFT